MSGEVENSKEEETKKEQQLQQRKSLKQRFHENWQIGIKILELLICSACMGFVYEPANSIGLGKTNMHHIGIMYTAFTGFMLINVIFLVSKAIGDRMPYRTTTVFSLSGAAMFLITGIVLVIDREGLAKHRSFHPNAYRLTMLMTSIILSFANVAVFIVDSVATYRFKENF